MDLVRDLITLGRNVREEVKIKVREPLSKAYVDGKEKAKIQHLVPLIEEELNVKEVVFMEDLSEYMNFTVKPNFKEVGKVFGPKIKDFQNCLAELTNEEIASLENDEAITIVMDNENVLVTPSMVDIRVEAKTGLAIAMEGKKFIILNTELTEELILEGIAREFVSKVQQLRKNYDFNVVDRIKIYYHGTDKFNKALEQFESYIKVETLAIELTNKDELTDSYDLNGEEVFMDIERV